MTSLGNELKQSNKSKFKSSKNMTATFRHTISPDFVPEGTISILRGELLRYSTFIPDVKDNIKALKNSNPKYLKLLNKIILVSIKINPEIDIDMCADVAGSSILARLLNQYNNVSYNNFEVLDFTQEVLNYADNLTSKYYLAHLAAGTMLNTRLKGQFKAAVPFVKYLASATLYSDAKDLTPQKNFMTGIKIIINEKADASKIELLPAIKQIVDTSSRFNHDIDIVKFIYSDAPITKINKNIKMLSNAVISAEMNKENIDCIDYLITNSL